jgi:hypothetical protein
MDQDQEGSTMRRVLAVLAVSAAALGAGLFANATRAATPTEKTFLLPASEGYGVADCLTDKSECGQVVADAWCEAQGFAASASYGIAAREDVTGAIDAPVVRSSAQPPIRITCKD